jgi:hypothetical protein
VQQDVAIVDEQVPYAAAVDYLTSARQLVAAKLLRNRVPLAGARVSVCARRRVEGQGPRGAQGQWVMV